MGKMSSYQIVSPRTHRIVKIYLSPEQAYALYDATKKKISSLTILDPRYGNIIIKQGKPVVDFIAREKHKDGTPEYERELLDIILRSSSVDLTVSSGYHKRDKRTGSEIEESNTVKLGNRDTRLVLEALENTGYNLYSGVFVGQQKKK